MKKIFIPLLVFIAIILLQTSTCYPDVDTSGVSSLIVYDKTYDTIILQKQPTTPTYPASITKVMTAIIILETVDDLDKKVVASEYVYAIESAFTSTALLITCFGKRS